MIKLLKEARDLLVMYSLLDKSGQCTELVEKIDAELDNSECKNFFNSNNSISINKCDYCGLEKHKHK